MIPLDEQYILLEFINESLKDTSFTANGTIFISKLEIKFYENLPGSDSNLKFKILPGFSEFRYNNGDIELVFLNSWEFLKHKIKILSPNCKESLISILKRIKASHEAQKHKVYTAPWEPPN